MSQQELIGRAIAAIDPERLVQDVIDLVNIDSPTGSESAMGEAMEARYADLGLQVIRQEVEPGRPNVFGILRGSGGGPRVGARGASGRESLHYRGNHRLVGRRTLGASQPMAKNRRRYGHDRGSRGLS